MKQAGFKIDEVVAATDGQIAGPPARGAVCAVSTDSRKLGPGQLFVALEGERFDGHAFLEAAAREGAIGAVVRRDHPERARFPETLPRFEVDDTLRALGDLAAHHRRRFPDLPVVAITGSNGKTTTRALCEAALSSTLGPGHATRGNFNNRVGLPLTLFELEAAHTFCILEMGMSEPGEIARLAEIADPELGLVTNVAGVHLEGLGSIEGVARAKSELYAGLRGGAVAIANADDPLLMPLAEASARARGLRLLTFGRNAGADLRLCSVEVLPEGLEATVQVAGGPKLCFCLALLGAHNALNATAALTVVHALGLDLSVAAAAMEKVAPVGRRLRQSTTASGALLLDDCYNANLVSMRAALETAAALARARGGALFAALGDMLELGTHSAEQHLRLGELAVEVGVTRLVAFGPEAAATEQAAAAIGARLHTADSEAAAAFLAGAGAGDVVLVKGSRGMKMERIVALLEAGARARGVDA